MVSGRKCIVFMRVQLLFFGGNMDVFIFSIVTILVCRRAAILIYKLIEKIK